MYDCSWGLAAGANNFFIEICLSLITYFVFVLSWVGVRLSPLGTSATVWPIEPAPDDRRCV
jgi:hypothetical protein